ncbi:MAG TPA: hypothetical protein VFM16_06190 [Holophagaceae bacterium]|nr:hypothetical protein [Holophagaceae bacterium]
MTREFLAAALIAPALFAQSPKQRLQEAWARATKFDLVGDAGEAIPPGLAGALDDVGSTWVAWVEAQESPSTKLPALPGADPAPSARLLGRRGPWILLGLQVPVPCGSHLFLALFREQPGHGKLVMLDLHEARSEADPLGAREHVQALLLEGPKVVVASTPPWCTSCWSTLHARVEAPGLDAQHPTVLTRFSDRIYRGADEDMLSMRPVKGGVRLRYQGMAGQDGTTVPRTEILRIH